MEGAGKVRQAQERRRKDAEAKKEIDAPTAAQRRGKLGFRDARPSEAKLGSFDCSLKKCRDFVRRLRGRRFWQSPRC